MEIYWELWILLVVLSLRISFLFSIILVLNLEGESEFYFSKIDPFLIYKVIDFLFPLFF